MLHLRPMLPLTVYLLIFVPTFCNPSRNENDVLVTVRISFIFPAASIIFVVVGWDRGWWCDSDSSSCSRYLLKFFKNLN